MTPLYHAALTTPISRQKRTRTYQRRSGQELSDHPIIQKLNLLAHDAGAEDRWVKWLMQGGESGKVVMPPYAPSSTKIRDFHRSRKQIRTIFGGNGSGKTEAGAYEVIRYAATHPNAEIWVCGVTYDAIGEYIWPKFKKYLPNEVLRTAKIAWVSSAKEIPAIMHLPAWGNVTIRFKSYEQGRRKFQGAAVDMAWLDEEPPKDVYDEVLARVSRTGGYILLTMTPLMGLTWAYNLIELAKDDDPYIFKTRIATGENKYLPEDAVNFMMATYGEEEAIRRIAGEFCQPSGAMWKEWKPERNIIPPFTIETDEPRYMGVDFGYTAPMAVTWMVKREDTFYLVEEYQVEGKLFEDHLRSLSRYPKWSEHLNATEIMLCDPEDAEKRAKLKHAFPRKHVKAANNAFFVGIDAVNRALKSTPSAEPRLKVFNTCKQTIYSASVYQIKPGKTKPEHEGSHLADTVRYQVMEVMKDAPVIPKWTTTGRTRVFSAANAGAGW